MRKTGRRTLAGIAAGALALALVPFVGAPAAQAVPTVQAFCDTNNAGGGGVLPDPTTVIPNCAVNAGLGVQATIQESVFGAAAGNTWYRLTVTGDSVFQAAAAPVGTVVVSADGKSVVADAAAMSLFAAPYDFWLTVPTQGTRTVAVETSTLVSLTPPGNADFAPAGDLTVTGTGTSTQALTSQAYSAVAATEPAATGIAPIGIVHLVDSGGNVLDLSGAAVGPITSAATSGTIGTALYTAGDCAPTGLLAAAVDPGDTRLDLTITDACATAAGAGVDGVTNSGLWVTWTGIGIGTAVPGNYTTTFDITLGGQTFPITVNYTVSNYLAVTSSGVSFDDTEYLPGEQITATVTLRDAGGLIVPDGLGWTGLGAAGRTWGPTSTTNAPIFNPTTGLPIAPNGTFPNASGTTGAATYKGVTTGLFLAPPDEMESFTMRLVAGTLIAENGVGWANSLYGTATSTSARIGNPTPPPPLEPTVQLVEAWRDKQDRVRVKGMTMDIAAGEVLNIRVTAYNRKAQAWTKWRVVDTTQVAANGTFREAFERKGKLRVRVTYPQIAASNVVRVAR